MTVRRPLAGLLVVLGMSSAAAAPPGPPAVLWRHVLPGWGQPAADDTTAFVLTRRHEVAALDLATGALRWRSYTGGPGDAPNGSCVRLAGRVAIVGDDAIVAFDRVTGETAWRFVPTAGRSPGIFLGDVVDGLVLAGSLSGDVYAIDAATGSLRWTKRVAPGQTTAVYPPVVTAGRIIVAFTEFAGQLSGGLAGFDLDGAPRWSRRLPAGVGATGSAVADGTTAILAATDGSIRAFSAVDGALRWRLAAAASAGRRAAGGRDIRALAAAGQVLVASSLNGELVGYDRNTRRRLWRYRDGPEGAAALRLVADRTHVYAPYTNGSLVAVSLATGRERWRTAPDADALEWPPLAHGQRLIAAGGRAVVALDVGAVPPSSRTAARPKEDR
jgi:outer membrane protein assembly factor BamB